MKTLKILLYILAGIAQVTIMPTLEINEVWPNSVLILSISLLLFGKEDEALLSALIGGLILDLTGSLRMGLNIVFFVSLIFILRFLNKKFFPETNILIVFITIFTSSVLFGFFNCLFLRQSPDLKIFSSAFYASILGLITFFIFNLRVKGESLKVGSK